MKVLAQGQRIVYVPGAELTHFESKSRKAKIYIEEVAAYKNAYRQFRDPYYNPNLSVEQLFSIQPAYQPAFPLPPTPTLLLASHNLNLEGAPLQLYEVALGLQERGVFHIEVYCPSSGPLEARYREAGIPVHIFPHPLSQFNGDPGKYQQDQEDFKEQLGRLQPDLVLVNTLEMHALPKLCADLEIPCSWHIHESSSLRTCFNHLPAFLKKEAFQSFQYPYALLFVSKSTRDLYQAVNYNRMSPVINIGLKPDKIDAFCARISPTEARSMLEIPEDKVMVLNLGTICERKGQKDMVSSAIRMIQAGKTDAYYVLVGAVSDYEPARIYQEEIQQMIQESGTEAHFRIVPLTPDVLPYYRAADIFACTSYNESYPRVILEAMRFGLPIVTTPVYGIKEQVLEDVNALYFNPGNQGLLAKQLERMILDPALRSRLGQGSQHIFGMINSYDEMLDAYIEVLQGTWLSGHQAPEYRKN